MARYQEERPPSGGGVSAKQLPHYVVAAPEVVHQPRINAMFLDVTLRGGHEKPIPCNKTHILYPSEDFRTVDD
jgi:hypothetical protein